MPDANLVLSVLAATPFLMTMAAAFVGLLAVPIWLGARMTGAGNDTFVAALVALVVTTVLSIVIVRIAGGGTAIWLVPLVTLLVLRAVLQTTFGGAFLLAIVAIGGYAALFQALNRLAVVTTVVVGPG